MPLWALCLICGLSPPQQSLISGGFLATGKIIGTALPASVDFRQADYSKPTIMLMGNEQGANRTIAPHSHTINQNAYAGAL